MVTCWIFLCVPAVGIVYYAFAGPSDFDQVVEALKGHPELFPQSIAVVTEITAKHGELATAVRLGGHSFYKDGISYRGSRIGLVESTPEGSRRSEKVLDGNYQGTYQASYLAWFREGLAPKSLIVARNVIDGSTTQYEVEVRGSRFIVDLFFFCAIGAGVALILFKVYESRKARRSPSSPPERR